MDTNSENEIKKRKTKAQLYQQEVDEAIREVMSTYQGRLVINKILEDLSIFRPVPIVDALNLAGAQAIQNFGKALITDLLTVNVNSFNIMRSEAIDRGKKYG